ncbi:class I SAM-dependent methyltransferase [Streptomyces sp. SID3212]|uniref:class I SAM-dependent methyltransferase n=1 Tax=unclassified Streptomyces TaxID=2593676 RepID=UPI001370748C|nr:class I SAM-dependent methyltransferase [Streptomyces sp. SID3212]MYV53988.1 methyltransferase domain-containing protein [Streptomyces sp. SID3212]
MAEPSFLTAVRESYDTVAADYVERVPPPAAMDPLSRAMLAGFAELVRTAGPGPVADLGCGPGRVTAHLAGLGVSAFGVDLSPKMIGLARQACPDLRFHEGSMTALELRDDELGGMPLDRVVGLLEQAGLVVTARLEQEPGGRVNRPRACLLARKHERA